jgi:hypothetical protein
VVFPQPLTQSNKLDTGLPWDQFKLFVTNKYVCILEMNKDYFNYFVMFFFIVVIIAMISKILRLQFSLFNVNIKEGLDSSDTTATTTSSCIDTTLSVSEVTDKIKKKVDSLSSKIKTTDRTEMENLITTYHELLSVWAINDLMVTDTSNNDCISKMVLKLSMYGNAEKCLESSLHWLDEQH